MADKIASKNIRLKYINTQETIHSIFTSIRNAFNGDDIRGIFCGETIKATREVHAVVYLKNKPCKRINTLNIQDSNCIYSTADILTDLPDVFNMNNKEFQCDDYELDIWRKGLSYDEEIKFFKNINKTNIQEISELKAEINELKAVGRLKEKLVPTYKVAGKGNSPSIVNVKIDKLIISSSSKSMSSDSNTPSSSQIKREINREKTRKIIKKYPLKHDFDHADPKLREEISNILKKIEFKKRTGMIKKEHSNNIKINLEINYTRRVITASNSSSEKSDELPLKRQRLLRK